MEEFLTLAAACQPGITQGRYEVTVSQTANIGCEIGDARLEFYVAAERVSLDRNEIYSVYPPSMSAGVFGNCLPHIILKRKTFPWERKLKGFPADAPWVMLMVFSEEEGVTASNLTYEQALVGKEGLYIPGLEPEDTDDKTQACVVIDIPVELFEDVFPAQDELPFLAHSRGVSLYHKVTDPSVSEDWFSCVVANRYPDKPKEGDGEYKKHTGYLVSLEGFEGYLTGERDRHPIHNCRWVRMFALTCWSFSVKKEPFDFPALARNLHTGLCGADVGNFQMPDYVERGYYPVEHQFRDGSVSVSWYRPPFLPHKGGRDELPLCSFSDKLLRYDPETGMFDITLSAAWQLGRLLCLQKKNLPQDIMRWRQKNKEHSVRCMNGRSLSRQLSSSGAAFRLGGYDEEAVKRSCVKEWKELMDCLAESLSPRET